MKKATTALSGAANFTPPISAKNIYTGCNLGVLVENPDDVDDYFYSTWLAGAAIYNDLAGTSLAEEVEDLSVASAGGVTYKINGVSVITEIGQCHDSSVSTYATCANWDTGGATVTYYTRYVEVDIIHYTSPFCFNSQRLSGTYTFAPIEYTFVDGIETAEERVCPFKYPHFADCTDAVAGDIGDIVGYLYSTEEIGDWDALTEVYSNVTLSSNPPEGILYVPAAGIFVMPKGFNPTTNVLGEPVASCSFNESMWSDAEEYRDNGTPADVDVYHGGSPSIQMGEALYTDEYLTSPVADGYLYGSDLIIHVLDGHIDVMDVCPDRDVTYIDCSMTTTIESYYSYDLYWIQGELLDGQVIYRDLSGNPSGWLVFSNNSFVHDGVEYDTDASGIVTLETVCGT